MTAILAEYWLEALLAVSGAVTVIGLLVNQVRLRREFMGQFNLACQRGDGIKSWLLRHQELVEILSKDFYDLNEKFKALDKPSNDKALENIAVILKKKISKQPTKLIRPKAKANGRSHAVR